MLKFVSLVLLTLFSILLFISNPSPAVFSDYLASELTSNTPTDVPLKPLVPLLANMFSDLAASNVFTRKNYIIFSIYILDFGSGLSSSYLALAGRFFKICS